MGRFVALAAACQLKMIYMIRAKLVAGVLPPFTPPLLNNPFYYVKAKQLVT
jgi:hypothetical protein